MDADSSLAHLEQAFLHARQKAETFATEFNNKLPSAYCPACGTDSHLPGLPCPECGYRHDKGWLVVKPTEFGYEVCPINDRRQVVARFNIPDSTVAGD